MIKEITPRHLKLLFLKQKQSLPLKNKIEMSRRRVVDWYEKHEGKVYIAFSGGKDSTVLLHIVRSVYPEVPAVFADTGLEYPEIREFVKSTENVIMVRPEMTFKKVIETYGYPVVSKKIASMLHILRHPNAKNVVCRNTYLTGVTGDGRTSNSWKLPDKWKYLIDAPFEISDKCCRIMKKAPSNKIKGAKFIGTMAADSERRQESYLETGCNVFDSSSPRSMPLSFWLEKDVWQYLKENNIPYSSIYDMGYERTGCMFCMFGIHLDIQPNRFQRMKRTHPKLYNYCIDGLGLGKVLEYLKIPYEDWGLGLGY